VGLPGVFIRLTFGVDLFPCLFACRTGFFFAFTTSFPICRFFVLPSGRKLRPSSVVDKTSLSFDIII
jgi:hypothetical protein